jgi:hypothetical protein
LEEVKCIFQKWLKLDGDLEVLDIVFACAIDRKVKGDPLWLFLISPSGGTKTEIVRSLKNNMIYTLDSLTPHTLISGKTTRNEEGESVPLMGILQEINGKVLIIKDFTVVLNKRREDRDEIFSQLRSLYDGYIEFAFGTLAEPVRIESHIGLIAACTPAIDAYSKLYLQLGERFLKVRHHPNAKTATAQAMKNLGKEEEMREELTGITNRFFLDVKDVKNKISETFLTEIQEVAQAVATLRTPVSISFWRFEVNEAAIPCIEYPTRLAKQLLKLAYALAMVRGKPEIDENEISTVRRVARDTCYPNRIRIVEAMINNPLLTTTREIADKAGLPLATCWRELKELEYLSLVGYTITEEFSFYGNKKHTPEKDGWKLDESNTPISCLFHSRPPRGDKGNSIVGDIVGGDACETEPPIVRGDGSETKTSREILHFSRISPNEMHVCDVCKGLKADFQQGINYFCKGCFDVGRSKAEAKDCCFSEDLLIVEEAFSVE